MKPAPQELRTFFTTTVTANRRRLFQVKRNAQLLIDLLIEDRLKHRYLLHAFVIMPDHAHFLITPAPDVSLEKAMQYIKGGFSFRLKSRLDVWEKSFMEHRITDAADYRNHLSYIEQNPVRAHLTQVADQFPYSSAADRNLLDPMPSHFGGSNNL